MSGRISFVKCLNIIEVSMKIFSLIIGRQSFLTNDAVTNRSGQTVQAQIRLISIFTVQFGLHLFEVLPYAKACLF